MITNKDLEDNLQQAPLINTYPGLQVHLDPKQIEFGLHSESRSQLST